MNEYRMKHPWQSTYTPLPPPAREVTCGYEEYEGPDGPSSDVCRILVLLLSLPPPPSSITLQENLFFIYERCECDNNLCEQECPGSFRHV